jgi:hypothetical protein
MKINLEENLKNQKKKDMEVLDSVKEVRLLLQNAESEDARILRNLSENSELNRVERITQTALEIERLESKYTGDIFTLEQIEKLAIDYRLRFLNSRYFTGKFDVEVAAKIKEFGRENNMSLNEYHLKNNFFILGPKEIFDLKDEKYIEPKQLDPVLFYKLDDNHYRMIHKWGSDFTILRYLEGFKWKNIWNHFWFNMFAFFPMFAFLIGLITSLSWATFSVGSMLLIASSVVVPTAIFVFFRYTISKMDSDGDEIKGFFTPGNWTSTNNIIR